MSPCHKTSLFAQSPLLMLITFTILAVPLYASATNSTGQHSRLRKSRATPRRLALCTTCAHGSLDPWWALWKPCKCEDGWEGSCCDMRQELHEGKDFQLHRIKNNEVEHELAFARTGSELPAALHGIYWMDQRGVNVPAGTGSSDPTYQQVGNSAADEFLVSFGETHWDAATRCAGPVPVYGGTQGHWTFMDQQGPPGSGSSSVWSGAYRQRLYIDFCFRSDRFDEIDLHVKFKLLGSYWSVPWSGLHLTMVKKNWGWDRQTTSLLTGSTVYHYPVFQIVDGDGKRTTHYDAYLNWANNDTTHTEEGFLTPINRGNGTSLVGRLAN